AAIQSDARLAIEGLHAVLADHKMARLDASADEVESARNAAVAAARRDVEDSMATGEMPMKGKAIVSEVNRVFGHDTILCKENGGQDLWVYYWPYYQVLDPGC